MWGASCCYMQRHHLHSFDLLSHNLLVCILHSHNLCTHSLHSHILHTKILQSLNLWGHNPLADTQASLLS